MVIYFLEIREFHKLKKMVYNMNRNIETKIFRRSNVLSVL